ncbi:hypothetical protein SLEP1_g56312 [Rubroshorea leprosula]|uniref:Uncharacterized protein n=1 Tax=Rubroshorea leprosula TaxID=152421 RepID=A0AAV5ML92_9ROSI|nr:hypothetical protein SLEP1_g56312 [Rubroshorea leprosula]
MKTLDLFPFINIFTTRRQTRTPFIRTSRREAEVRMLRMRGI